MIGLLIGAVLSILIPYLFYRYILKGYKGVGKKPYIITFILGATLYTLPIIVLEIIWDILFKGSGDLSFAGSFAQAFFRAALLEEAVKFFFCCRVLKKLKGITRKEAILLAGVVGIGYGFTEKLVYGTGLAMIMNALSPGHMVFQWIMGYYIFRAMTADGKEKRSLLLRAYFVPFMLHGLWDFGLDVVGFIMDMEPIALMLAGGLLLIAMFVAFTVFEFKAAKRIRKIED